jgi:hypothetical protein
MNAVSTTSTTSVTSDAKGDSAWQIPQSWRTAAMGIPYRYRQAALDNAIADRRALIARHAGVVTGARQLELNSLYDTTPLSGLYHASFCPFHLAREEDREMLTTLLQREGSSKVLQHILEKAPGADTLLVCSDTSLSSDRLSTALDQMIEDKPARYLSVGPGQAAHKVIRDYAERREFTPIHIQSMGGEDGALWSKADSKTSEKLVLRIFREHKPARILVFEPVQSAATKMVVEAAAKLSIPVRYVQPAPSRRPSP